MWGCEQRGKGRREGLKRIREMLSGDGYIHYIDCGDSFIYYIPMWYIEFIETSYVCSKYVQFNTY